MRAAILLLLAVVVAIPTANTYLLDGLEGSFWCLVTDESTQYSPGYSDGAFRRIHPGMSERELVDRLGSPLGESWVYGKAPRSALVVFAGEVVDHIDVESGELQALSGISPGLTKSIVLKAAGEPLEKRLAYSQSRGDNYRIRVVAVSRGAVKGKIAECYLD